MVTGTGSSTGGQDRGEKKDHPRRGGSHRGDAATGDWEDPDRAKAKGEKTYQSQSGRKGGSPSTAGGPPIGDNTEPGGNRPKGSRRGQDHN